MLKMNNILEKRLGYFKISLWIQIVLYSIALFLSLIIYGYIIYKQKELFFISTCVIISLYSYIIYTFIVKIYSPIIKIKDDIGNFGNNGIDLENNIHLDFNNDIYSLSENISSMLYKLEESMNREYKNLILKKQAEFTALQSQINPHFLYNTLDSIRGEALIEKSEKIAEMTEALSTFFRYSISQKGGLVSVNDELDNVNNYMIIQQYRFNNKFGLNIIYDDKEILDFMLPKMTLQPIAENAIMHGLETKLGKGLITLRIIRTEKRLIINISDNGIGIDNKTVNELNKKLNNNFNESIKINDYNNTGIALVNVNQRIKLLFGKKYGVSITSTESIGTDVEIIIPLVRDNDKEMFGLTE